VRLPFFAPSRKHGLRRRRCRCSHWRHLSQRSQRAGCTAASATPFGNLLKSNNMTRDIAITSTRHRLGLSTGECGFISYCTCCPPVNHQASRHSDSKAPLARQRLKCSFTNCHTEVGHPVPSSPAAAEAIAAREPLPVRCQAAAPARTSSTPARQLKRLDIVEAGETVQCLPAVGPAMPQPARKLQPERLQLQESQQHRYVRSTTTLQIIGVPDSFCCLCTICTAVPIWQLGHSAHPAPSIQVITARTARPVPVAAALHLGCTQLTTDREADQT
jgi:hypothetical protein